jgi:methenyltetrahydromethanopterin cyclohydrolase
MDPRLPALDLNRRALAILDDMAARAPELRVEIEEVEGGRRIDAGVRSPGGLEAGLLLARACMAGLGRIDLAPGDLPHPRFPRVAVATDHPVAACMASQYAGWQISAGKFFAMGSGPMRAAYGGEDLFARIGFTEKPGAVAGILECGELPGPDVFRLVAGKTGVGVRGVTLAAAATRSIAGSIQVVARSVETALHKLHALGFDIARVVSGAGSAPLPPPARDDLAAIGRTNDAVLYGGSVTLWVRGDDDSIAEIGPRVPSSASPDHGAPFAEIFERHGRDFYAIDPHLFSPAEIAFQNLDTGRSHRHGSLEPGVLERSFFG